MEHLIDVQAEAAEARGRAALETEPRAVAARYNRKTGRVTVDLANGCAYVFPADLVQDLSDANPDDMTSVEVDGEVFSFAPTVSTEVSGVDGADDGPGWVAQTWGALARRVKNMVAARSPD